MGKIGLALVTRRSSVPAGKGNEKGKGVFDLVLKNADRRRGGIPLPGDVAIRATASRPSDS